MSSDGLSRPESPEVVVGGTVIAGGAVGAGEPPGAVGESRAVKAVDPTQAASPTATVVLLVAIAQDQIPIGTG